MATYFNNMNEINPEDWTIRAAVVYETDLTGGKRPFEVWGGSMNLSQALDHYKGRCERCNHHHRHFVVLQNTFNDDVISVGFDCYNSTFAFGSKKELDIEKSKKAAERMMWKAEKDAKKSAYVSEHAELVAFLEANQNNSFFASLLNGINTYGALAERQESAALKAMQEALEPKVEVVKVDAPEGRITDVFTVASMKVVDNGFGGVLKMRATNDKGYAIWVSVPDKIEIKEVAHPDAFGSYLYCHQVDKGDKIQMSVTLKQSDNDKSFAYGSRPTKAVYMGR